MIAWGVVVAAGRGERLGDPSGVPKALQPVAGRAMYLRALDAFDAADGVAGAVLVVPPLWNDDVLEKILGAFHRPVEMVNGGPTRQSSVRAGLAAVPEDADAVIVHDAARPLVTPELIARALAGLEAADGAACAVPLSDTIKRAVEGRVVETPSRDGLFRVQTPQAFRAGMLRRAHADAARDGVDLTDDAALVERAGGTIVLVEGDERNVKVTTAGDLAIAEALLSARV